VIVSTYFGHENEISGYTWLGGQGVNQNQWMLVLRMPGSDILDVLPPVDKLTECPQTCQNPCINSANEEVVKIPPAPGCDQGTC